MEGAEAGEAPGGHDDLLDQEVIDGADGLEVIQERLKGLVEEVCVFAGNDGVLGGEAITVGDSLGRK